MSQRVIFWTEGGAKVGMGHLSRCISIARVLSSMDIPSRFFVNADSAVMERLRGAGFEHSVAPIGVSATAHIGEETVVLDTKSGVDGAVRRLKEAGKSVVVIDNPASAGSADALIMPYVDTKGIKRAENLYSGSPYVVIGENFRASRDIVQRPPFSLPLKVMVTMGGADPNNLTDMVVDALWNLSGIEVSVIIGPASRPSGRLMERMREGRPGFVFTENVEDLAPFMGRAHIAFTAVGITVYELAYMGVPSVLIANYREDGDFLDALTEARLCLSLGYFKDVTAKAVMEAAEAFIRDKGLLEDMSTRAVNFTDGRGAERIAGIISRLSAHSGSSCCGAHNECKSFAGNG